MHLVADQSVQQAEMPAEHSARPVALEPPSVVVLTKDEEVNIEACLRTLTFSDDIVVLDSYSTDRTVELAKSFPNVRVVQRHFDTEWKQRNFGLQDIPYKHPWVYICDADERVPQDLVDEMMQKINSPSLPYMAYRLRYKNMYLGKWIKHASGYPVWLIRHVRPEDARRAGPRRRDDAQDQLALAAVHGLPPAVQEHVPRQVDQARVGLSRLADPARAAGVRQLRGARDEHSPDRARADWRIARALHPLQ